MSSGITVGSHLLLLLGRFRVTLAVCPRDVVSVLDNQVGGILGSAGQVVFEDLLRSYKAQSASQFRTGAPSTGTNHHCIGSERQSSYQTYGEPSHCHLPGDASSSSKGDPQERAAHSKHPQHTLRSVQTRAHQRPPAHHRWHLERY